MGRPGLSKNRKFPRLVRALQPECKRFAEQAARGSLELLWDTAYENGEDYVGDAADVEAAARWIGKPGILCRALLTAGGEGESGFIDEIPERPGHFVIHDLYDHAPEYVKKRMAREASRIEKGQTISAIRREAALKRHHKTDATGNQLQTAVVHTAANVETPAPAPAPAHAPAPFSAPDIRDERRRSPTHQAGDHQPPLEEPARAFPEELAQQLGKRISASPKTWRAFIADAIKHPARQREAAAREFLRRSCPEQGHGLAYLLGMIREGAGNPRPDPVPLDRRSAWERAGFESHEAYEAAGAERTQEILRQA